MSTLEDKLAFVHIKSHKQQVLQRITIYVFFIMMLIPLGYGVYKLLMQWDYNNLKHYIESDIMQGYDKLYDYTLSIQDDEIRDIESLHILDKQERTALSALFNPSWKYDAYKARMPRYSEPFVGNIPFCITSIEKNTEGGYDIKTYNAVGIVYKTQTPSFEILKEQEKPKKVYDEAFRFLCETFDDYHLSLGCANDIKSLTPNGYIANKAGYDKTHVTSKFHSIDRQNKTMELPSGRTQEGYGYNGTGEVENSRNKTVYSYEERYLQIQEHPYNQLSKIMIISIGVAMTLCYLCLIIYIPHIRRKLRLSGYIWVTDSKSEAVIFYNNILGRPKVQFINNDNNDIFTYSTSKDGNRIMLSNGDILVLKVCLSEDSADGYSVKSIEIRKCENILTYYKLQINY